jgi:hypothetical protein
VTQGDLRCPCGVLFYDKIHRLSVTDAESLVESSTAALITTYKQGRFRALAASPLALLAAIFVPWIYIVDPFVAVIPAVPALIFGMTAIKGWRSARAARRALTANRIQLPAARVLPPTEK